VFGDIITCGAAYDRAAVRYMERLGYVGGGVVGGQPGMQLEGLARQPFAPALVLSLQDGTLAAGLMPLPSSCACSTVLRAGPHLVHWLCCTCSKQVLGGEWHDFLEG
jgi:hypothetical protein